MYNVDTLAPSFMIGSSSFFFLQVARTTIMSRMISKFSQIQPWTAEFAALDQLKKSFTYLRTIQKILMTSWLSGERSLPFGLLVMKIDLTRVVLSYEFIKQALGECNRYSYELTTSSCII